jgi:hypothetical protein
MVIAKFRLTVLQIPLFVTWSEAEQDACCVDMHDIIWNWFGADCMRRHVGIKLFTNIIWNNLIVTNHCMNEHIFTYFIPWSTFLQWFKTMILSFKPALY